MALRHVFVHQLAVGVLDAVVGAPLGIDALVAQGRVALAHLPHGLAVGELAQGHARIAHVVGLDHVGHAQLVLELVEAHLGGQHVHHLGGHGVDGDLERVAQGDAAVVLAVVVVGIPGGAVEPDLVGIVEDGPGPDQVLVQAEGIGGDGLDGAAGAALHLGGPVEAAAVFLLADAAAHAQDVPGEGVHDHDGALQVLGRGFHIAGGQVVKGGIYLVDDVLHAHVDGGIDAVARVEEQGLRRVVVHFLQLHELVDHVLDDGVHIPAGHVAVHADDPLLFAFLVLLGAEVELFGLEALVFLLRLDVALVVHLLEDDLLPVLVGLGVEIGVVGAGVVGDADDAGTFRRRQLALVLAEILQGGGLDAVAAVAEKDRVEIPFDDLLFCIGLFQLQGAEDLRQLALDGEVVVVGHVFQQLLGEGGAAEHVVRVAEEHGVESAEGAEPVHAVVVIEAVVLDGDGGLLEPGVQVFVVHPLPVTLEAGQAFQHFPLLAVLVEVIDGAGLVQAEFVQGDGQLVLHGVFHICGKDHDEKETGAYGDEEHRQHDLHGQADDPAHGAAGGDDGFLGDLLFVQVPEPVFEQCVSPPPVEIPKSSNIIYPKGAACQ